MAIGDPNSVVQVEKPPQVRSPIGEDAPGKDEKIRTHQMPGEYKISKCDLLSPNIEASGSGGINIIPMIDQVYIYENINTPYLLAEFEIHDGMGLREQVPIIGEEFISFEAATLGFTAGEMPESDNNLDGIVKKVFRVYSISPIIDNTPTMKTYVLRCISIEAIISEKRKISKGYKGVKIERVVQDLYKNYIAKPLSSFYGPYQDGQAPKKLHIEPTADIYDFCFPFKSPFDIIENLAEKATPAPEMDDDGGFENVGYGEASVDPGLAAAVKQKKEAQAAQRALDNEDENAPADGALYMFYETLSAFKFESLETSFKREPKRHIVSTVSTEHDPELIKQKVHVPGQLNNAEKYQVDSLFDVVQNMREGMYSSKLITHDIIRMRYNQIGYRYIENKDQHEAEIHAAEFSETPTTVAGKTPDADTSRRRLIDLTRQLGPGKLCSYNHDCLLDDSGGEGSLVKFTATNMNHSYFLAHNRKGPGGGGREPGINENNVELRVQKRASQLQQLDNIKITVKIPGDSSLRVGDIIEWHMPSQIMNEDHAGGDDFFLGGKYLITKIKHSFSMERYTQELQLRKDSLHNWAPGLEIEKVVTTKDVSAEAEVGQFGDEVAEEINSTPLVVMTPMAGADPTAKAMEGVGGPPWYDKAGELIGSEYGTDEFGGSGPPDYKPQAAYGPVYGSREDALKSHMPPGYDPATNTQN